MNERIEIKPEWDGSHTILLDGDPVFTRQPLRACEQKAAYLDALLAVGSIQIKRVDKPKTDA